MKDNELFNPILRILDRRRAVADCVSEIRLFFDRNRIPIPQDIDDVFNATTQSLDEIIRQAALMQEIDRTNALNQDLIRTQRCTTANQAESAGKSTESNSKPTESDAEHRRNAHRLMLRYNADTERWRRRHAGCIRQAQNWQRQYRISQTQVQAQAQNILNLQQQILALQNNPPNMATIQDVMHTISPGLAQLPFL
ncbi:unnamed protein product [Rhizophagus irregularis]|nr:unnamed protein product [Rhizophagus irregularis]